MLLNVREFFQCRINEPKTVLRYVGNNIAEYVIQIIVTAISKVMCMQTY